MSEPAKKADKFNTPKPGIRVTDVKSSYARNIVTVPVPKKHIVENFSPETMKDSKGMRYTDIMKTNAVSDDRRNQRFRMSEHLRTMTSVSDEEENRIEAEVKRRIDIEISAIQDRVTKEAYEAGLKSGKVDAELKMLTEIRPVVDKLHRMLVNFEEMKFDVFKANEDLLIRMVYRLAKMVTLKEIKEDTAYTKRLILQLLERLGTRENIKILVSPEAFSTSDALKAGLAESIGQLKNITIEVDPAIHDVGCRIETDYGEVDARIETQLSNIAATLEVDQS